ncbi:MAG TPA: hypothetical protein VK533_11630, partial [Sphingomonas sp.]|nr:hypothetical protein [Sphingomonas sp.]
KLYEELLIGNDPITTAHPRIMMANEAFLPWDKLSDRLEELSRLLDRQDAAGVRFLLTELVPEYVAGTLTDWVSSVGRATDAARVVSLDRKRVKSGGTPRTNRKAVKRPVVS